MGTMETIVCCEKGNAPCPSQSERAGRAQTSPTQTYQRWLFCGSEHGAQDEEGEEREPWRGELARVHRI